MSAVPAALPGLRVIDFSQGVAGPHIGMLLALHGADVVKVEPKHGDWGRVLGTCYGDFSAYSLNFNRGKRSLAIDLKAEAGLRIARRLVADADVVIEAFRPGVMAKLGLGYDDVQRANPRAVYVSVTGFGQTGVNAALPVTDGAIQGSSGLMNLNRAADGTPQRFPMVLIDVTTGLYGTQAVMAALLRRSFTGVGAYIDCSLMQSALALQAPALLEHQFEHGSPDVLYVPLGVVKTSDGYLSIAVRTEPHFAALCKALDRPDLGADPEYADRKSRVRNEKRLMAELAKTFATRTSKEWSARLVAAQVTHSVVRSYQDVMDDPETARAQYIDALDHQGFEQPVQVPNIPGVPNAASHGRLAGCPRIGEHTAEVLGQLGLGADEIGRLAADGVVRDTCDHIPKSSD